MTLHRTHFLMKTIIYTSLLMLIICSCKQNKEEDFFLDNNTISKTELKPYAQFKEELKSFKGNMTEKQDRFFTYINTDIPNYWIGTKWDFNGTTQQPKTGTIACGYFVTTILDDFGIKLKRTYLAQQVSSVMISELCKKTSIKNFSTIQQMERYLKNRNNHEIYIIGLDFHTGFIIRDNDKNYFLHSNYINKEGVLKEEISNSRALHASKSFMIGSLSQNEEIFK